jgi:integrase
VAYSAMILRRALKDAVRWGDLARNPAEFADPPRVRNVPQMKTWTTEQAKAFRVQAKDDRLGAAWTLMLTTGMRRGECLGLRWEDIDLGTGRVQVVQSLGITVDGPVLQAPKTGKGRSITLDQNTVAVLKDHRLRQLEERIAGGPGYEDSGLVFTGDNGGPLRPDNFSRAFQKLVKGTDLPRIRLQDLRHTYASLALAAAVPVKVVSERLGHANVTTTLNIYAHVLPGMESDAAEQFADTLFGA